MLAKSFSISLSKAFHGFQLNFPDTQNYNHQHIISKSNQLKIQTTELVNKIISDYTQELASIKKQAKTQRKQKQGLTATYSKNKVEWDSERRNMQNQIQRCGLKISQLLKDLLKKQNQEFHQKKVMSTDQEIQCQLQFLDFKEVMEIYEKQNISLSKIIIQLKQIINQKQEQIQAEKILICQLIEELSTQEQNQLLNVSMRCSQLQSSESENQNANVEDLQQRESQSVQQYSQKEDEGDTSTIAGISDTGDRDYALPEWMQFDEGQKNENGIRVFYQHEQQQNQTWFEIILQKTCSKFQLNNFLI